MQMGTFSVASEEVMKNRAVKKAKRRNAAFEVSAACSLDGFLKRLPIPRACM